MASLSKGHKALVAANKAAEDARKAADDLTKSTATRTPQQVTADQTGAAIKHAANQPDTVYTDGQSRLEASEEALQARYAAISAFATECGEALSTDDAFVKFERDVAGWKRDLDYKAVYCMKFLEKNLTKDQLARLPWPKTAAKDVKGNEDFDIIKMYEMQSNGESKLVATSFYKQMARATPEGKRAYEKIKTLKTSAEKDGLPDRKSDESGERSDFNTIVGSMETAGKIILQGYRLSMVEDVAWEWIKDAKGEIKKTPKCIMAWSPSNMQTLDYHSISQMVGWKIHKVLAAKKKGIIAVRASVGKTAPPTPPPDAKKTKFNQLSNREMLDAMSEALSYYGKGNVIEQSKRHVELLEMARRSDEDKITLVELYRMLKPMCEGNNGELQRLADQAKERISKTMEDAKKVA